MWHSQPTPPPPLWRYVFYPPEKGEYTYFQGKRPDDPTASTADRAAWMADAAMLAYGRYGPQPMSNAEFAEILQGAGYHNHTLIGDWNSGANGTQGVLAYNDSYAVLSFRGTEKDDWKDFATNAFLWPVELAITTGGSRALLNRNKPGVHAGFQRSLAGVWSDVSQCLQSYRSSHGDSSIYFTGHSLGAALALLAFSQFTSGATALYTFGCPRTGNRAFCDGMAGREIHRFVNGQDLVPHIPTESLWYAHTPGLQHIQADGTIRTTEEESNGGAEFLTALRSVGAVIAGGGRGGDQPAPPTLADHAPVRYCYWTAENR